MRSSAILSCILALGLAGCGYRAATPSASAPEAIQGQGGDVLARYLDVSQRKIRLSATMVARFVGRLPQAGRQAEIQAQRVVQPTGSVEYRVIHRAGDSGVQKDVIARFMNAEMESASKEMASISITPAHYRFRYRGQKENQGMVVHVFDVTPRRKEIGLFKGEIWLDAETGLTVREAGRLVKTPSVFLKQVDFAREYAIQNGRAVPKMLKTNVMTRFWGPAEIEILYSDVTFTGGPLAEAASTGL